MKKVIIQKARDLQDYLKQTRRHLHQHPEVGFHEHETTAFLRAELRDTDVELLPTGLDTGLVGILHGRKGGGERTTALRADMDALPIEEKTGLPYASQNLGVMHACGHDGNTTVLLGVLKLLNSMRDQFSGKVLFIFQPAEELLTGARKVLASGLLEPFEAGLIVALHGDVDIPIGKIGLFSGPYMAAADKFSVRMVGKGTHAARPDHGIDPVLASAHAIVALQSIISREVDAMERAVVSVCTLHAGKAFNVIPEETIFSGTVRCLDEEVRKSIQGKIDRIVKGISGTFGCRYELDYQELVPALVNDPEVCALVAKAASTILGEEGIVGLDRPVMGSEDFSVLMNHIGRGAFFRLGLADPDKARMILHNDRYDFNDEALPVGVSVLTQLVLMVNQ